MPYSITHNGRTQTRYLYGARPFCELLTRDELDRARRNELVGVSERGSVLDLSSPLEDGASVTLCKPQDVKLVDGRATVRT